MEQPCWGPRGCGFCELKLVLVCPTDGLLLSGKTPWTESHFLMKNETSLGPWSL